jgi:DNA-binding XRE family transcriptional regulator
MWRDRYGYSQTTLAQLAQVSRSTISRAEQGRRIAPKQADAIAAVFRVPRAKLAQPPDQEKGEAAPEFALTIAATTPKAAVLLPLTQT